MGIVEMVLALVVCIASLALTVAILVYCAKMTLLFFSHPVVKGISIVILLFAAFICLKDLDDTFSWENLLYGVLCIAICVGLVFLKSSNNYQSYSRKRRRNFEDDSKRFVKKQKNSSHSHDVDWEWKKHEEKIRRQQEEVDRKMEENERRQREHEEKMKEAERRRGRPVAGGACQYLYERDTGYYEGWRIYRCDVTGAEFEDGYCRKHCLYAKYFYECPYSGYR